MEWITWTSYERALTYVHDEGTTTVRGRPAGRFTGLVDMFRKQTIARMPDPHCPAATLVIDLYLDETTGTLLRYDLRPLHTGPTTRVAAGLTSDTLITYTDFGVPVPAPVIPDPATVQPRFDPKPGTGITMSADTTVPPGC
ncbi:hypothetical protein [Actinocorallia populi]|uniref:hypothetical protein n=1 Tax=Actinocorallia populi TaxID=2079200 RepID=UPI000D095909|nr:hypothetical protein [Actinocorallia populi]